MRTGVDPSKYALRSTHRFVERFRGVEYIYRKAMGDRRDMAAQFARVRTRRTVRKIRVTHGSRATQKSEEFRGAAVPRLVQGWSVWVAGRWNVDCGEEGFDCSIPRRRPREQRGGKEGSRNEEW